MDAEFFSSKVDQASSTAKDFTKLYYKNMDKSRHLVGKLYMDTGILVWNGNESTGDGQILKFLLDLPATEHILTTLDAQPIMEGDLTNQQTILVQASGTVKYQDNDDRSDKQLQNFQQTFMLTAQGDKWKIVSDCFRLQGIAA